MEPPVPELLPVLDGASDPSGPDDTAGKQIEASKEFLEVRMKRKRKAKGAEMEVDQPEVEDGASLAKRPSFPPVDASTTLVSWRIADI